MSNETSYGIVVTTTPRNCVHNNILFATIEDADKYAQKWRKRFSASVKIEVIAFSKLPNAHWDAKANDARFFPLPKVGA